MSAVDEISDAALLQAYVDGDAAAMDVLIGRYRRSLFAWLMGMTGNRADAEDLYQEVWLRVIKHAWRFNNVSFKAWMWRIARNLLIDFRRKRKPDISLDAVIDEDSQPLIDRLESKIEGPDKVLTRNDLMAHVMRAVQTLPEMQREVFLLRVQSELSFTEIATLLRIPLNTALGRMHDAMGELKGALALEE